MSQFQCSNYKRPCHFFVWGALLGTLTGCGGASGIVQNLKLETRTDSSSGDVYLETRGEIKIGNLRFPNFSLPVVDPSQPGKSYGQITLQRTLDSKNVLIANINMTEAAHIPGLSDNRLPNGNPIPVANAENIIALRAGQNTRVYFGTSSGRSIFGVAVAISEFDSIARYVPGANLFFDLPVRNNISGLAGIFTSVNSGESGLALFIDATQQLQLNTKTPKLMQAQTKSRIFKAGSNQNDRKTRELQNKMYQLSQKRIGLRVK